MFQDKTVVIIDDDKDLVKLIAYALKAEGINTLIFYTGKEALSFVSEQSNLKNISLIILDRMLPDIDGVEILKKIIEKNKKDIPVLILSNLSADQDILHALEMGAVDYIVKPFNLELFVKKSLNLIQL